MTDEGSNDTKFSYQAIKDIAKDAVKRGVIDEDAADSLVKTHAKNTESRKIVFKTRATLVKLRKNIIEYWIRYMLLSAGLSGGGAWTFRDSIGQALKTMGGE